MMQSILSYKETLLSAPLFHGLSDDDLLRALSFFGAVIKRYEKGAYLHHVCEPMKRFGLVLSGSLQVCSDDLNGNRMIMADVTKGGSFGESLCFLNLTDEPVYAYATDDCTLLLLSCDAFHKSEQDRFSVELFQRFTAVLARRTLSMNGRIQILSKLTLREKLMTYFSELSQSGSTRSFTVSLNREDMAAYLGTNRSALSRELSNMQKEGILRFSGKRFEILATKQ